MSSLYQEKHPVMKMNVPVRNLSYTVNTWGDHNAPTIFFLHGWADVGNSFQFIVDELAHEWFCIAPDWRGFGDTDRCETYWFPDYLADLDCLLTYFAADDPVRLIGHSMGGNVACQYAGIFPARVSHLMSIDAFGLRDSDPVDAPQRYSQWLMQMRQSVSMPQFNGWDELATHVLKLAPNITPERAEYIAKVWGTEHQGKIKLKADPKHKRVNPVLYRREENRACWGNIQAKSALVMATDSVFYQNYIEQGGREDSQACIPQLEEFEVAGSGHMIHLEQPEKLAALVQAFLA